MKKRIAFTLIFCFISISFLFAQSKDITGHWKGRLMDQYDIVYDFVSTGDSLSGKSTHEDGTTSDISNGKVNGDSISYDVPIRGDITHITGKLSGDVVSIYFSYMGYDLSADLKKTTADTK